MLTSTNYIHTLTAVYTHTHTQFLSHTISHIHSYWCIHTFTCTLSFTHIICLTHSLRQTVTDSLAHTHTLKRTTALPLKCPGSLSINTKYTTSRWLSCPCTHMRTHSRHLAIISGDLKARLAGRQTPGHNEAGARRRTQWYRHLTAEEPVTRFEIVPSFRLLVSQCAHASKSKDTFKLQLLQFVWKCSRLRMSLWWLEFDSR